MSESQPALSPRQIAAFWSPLAATWAMMALEGPFLAAVIARMADPKYNLAAYGVAFSLALIVEAPIIMIMSAATALVRDTDTFRRMRRYTYTLNAAITAAMLVGLLPPVFRFLTEDLIGLTPTVANLTHGAAWLLLPWPAAIGYRRFYQGVMIRHGRTRSVAYGTVIRLSSMSLGALGLHLFSPWPGAWVGAAALSTGVLMEAAAARWMARGAIRRLAAADGPTGPPLTTAAITRFYYPLALTSLLTLGVHPLVTFFVGNSRFPLESLAVLPVVNSLVFVFRSLGLSYQEAVIALLGERGEQYHPLRRFATVTGAAASLTLALLVFTPLADWWFQSVAGLTPDLARFALTPARIVMLLPALEVLLSFQRGQLVAGRRTTAITWGTLVEVGTIVLVLPLAIHRFDAIGAVAAASAVMSGRVLANLFLTGPCRKVSRHFAAVAPARPAS